VSGLAELKLTLAAKITSLLDCPNADAPFHTGRSCSWCVESEEAQAALAALLARIEELERAQERLRDLARRAQSQAAAPDYDEKAIRLALWKVVGAALGSLGKDIGQ
jgi:ABC-type uncharacterized transport system fused permease/ATPase subunit